MMPDARGDANSRMVGNKDRYKDDEGYICQEGYDRHNAASSTPGLRVMLDLRVIQWNCLLSIRPAHMARLRYGAERCDPP